MNNNRDSCAIIPQNLEAEVGVLGAILVEGRIVGEILPLLDSSYFIAPAHQLIFEAICALFDNNQIITPVAVQEKLKHKGVLEQIGGEAYLVSLMEVVFSAANAPYYAKVVREKGILRELIKTAKAIEEEAQNERTELDTLLDRAERMILEITQKGISNEPCHIKNLLLDILSDVEKKDCTIKGIATGYSDLDRMTGGLQNSSLIIIAGRPSMGKSSLALNITTHVSLHNNIGVLFFSLEMSKEQICQNILCAQARISPHKIRTGTVEDDEYKLLSTEVSWLAQAPIFIDDSGAISLRDIKAKSRRFKLRYDIGLVIIDYIQLIETGESRYENRQQEISQISRGLKSLARELDIPVIALSQLNRSVDARDDHHPRMSDLRESGALEQDADLILFLYREEYYDKNTAKKNVADVIVAKHRNGPTGEIQLFFTKEYMRFWPRTMEKEGGSSST